MPAGMERALMRQARKLGLTGERRNAFIYGTMRKYGWRPSRELRGRRLRGRR